MYLYQIPQRDTLLISRVALAAQLEQVDKIILDSRKVFF